MFLEPAYLKKIDSSGKNIVKECEKALERIKCSKVKNCETVDEGDAKNLCAWCPTEGRAFVYDKAQESRDGLRLIPNAKSRLLKGRY